MGTNIGREMLIAAGLLMGFAVVGTALVAYTHEETAERISHNQRETLLNRLNQILPAGAYDNDLVTDTTTVHAPQALGSEEPLPVYRARRGNEPVAAVLTVIAPNGYNGPIKMLVGVYRNGELAGVRVVSHTETPGLGDAIETEKSDWIEGFEGKSLGQPPAEEWKVKKDGGAFDQFTGATITPRAVVQAVYRALEYFQANKAGLFAAPKSGEPEQPPPEAQEQLNYPTERGEADVR